MREVAFDGRVQLAEPVARHAGVHVVFDVVIHVPVEEAEERIQDDRAGAEPKVWHVVLQADVLGVVAQKQQPAAVERGQRNEHWYHP